MTDHVSIELYDQEKAFQEELAKIQDPGIKEKLNKMKSFVLQRIALERQFRVEQAKLESKYEELYRPMYDKRSDIINGKTKIEQNDIEGVLPEVTISDFKEKETGIPDYWLTCLKNSSQFGSMVNTNDEKVLKFLTDIKVEYKENGDFTLSFHFGKNEFFDHSVLTRVFTMDEKMQIKQIDSTSIQWTSEELNPTVAKKKKKVKVKGSTEVKTVVKTENVESFFTFFKNYVAPSMESKKNKALDNLDNDDDEERDENEFIDEEFDLGVFIKDELIPYSLEYYLNIIDEEDDGEEDCEEDDENDEDEMPDVKKKPKLF